MTPNPTGTAPGAAHALSVTLRRSLVWYAAYGSNLKRARFAAYLSGGPVPGAPGSAPPRPGARNRALPKADRRLWVRGSVYFAGRSRTWGNGGVAYLDPSGATNAAGRAWLITGEQFLDVFAQENGLALGVLDDPTVDADSDRMGPHWPALDRGEPTLAAERPYGLVLPVGRLDGFPVLTFTAPQVHQVHNPPHSSYRQVIEDGRAEAGWPAST